MHILFEQSFIFPQTNWQRPCRRRIARQEHPLSVKITIVIVLILIRHKTIDSLLKKKPCCHVDYYICHVCFINVIRPYKQNTKPWCHNTGRHHFGRYQLRNPMYNFKQRTTNDFNLKQNNELVVMYLNMICFLMLELDFFQAYNISEEAHLMFSFSWSSPQALWRWWESVNVVGHWCLNLPKQHFVAFLSQYGLKAL